MKHFRLSTWITTVAFAIGCVFPNDSEPSSELISAQPWPEADALFQNDPEWLTGDGLYSVDLGNGRVLWLFGDSFVATTPRRLRSESRIVRNSMAIQSGYDPATASIEFYWRVAGGEPQSFFPDEGETWFWPGDAVLAADILVIFLMRIRSVQEGLGFAAAGWEAVVVANPQDDPDEWSWTWASIPDNTFGVNVGGATVLRIDDHVHAFGAEEEDSGNAHLVRWLAADAVQGELDNPEWWIPEDQAWVSHDQLAHRPAPMLRDAQSEFTVHYEPRLERYLLIQTTGFGATDLGLRVANQITGPYSKLEPFYRPEEYDDPDAFIYEGKSHPELVGADVVLTYFPSSFDFGSLVNDMDRGWPRFLRGTIARSR